MTRSATFSGFLGLLISVSAWLLMDGNMLPVRLTVEYAPPVPRNVKIYIDVGHGFREVDAERLIPSKTDPRRFASQWFRGSDAHRLRLDPATRPAELSLRDLCLQSALRTSCLRGASLARELLPMNEVSTITAEDGLVRLELLGHDPQVHYAGDFGAWARAQAYVPLWLILTLGFAAGAVLALCWPRARTRRHGDATLGRTRRSGIGLAPWRRRRRDADSRDHVTISRWHRGRTEQVAAREAGLPLEATSDLRSLFQGPYLALLLIAVAAHLALGWYAPDPKGYAYDLYVRAVYVVYGELRLPHRDECWVCYHPPLYPVMGALVFKLVAMFGGELAAQEYALSAVSVVASLVLSVFGFQLYRRFRKHPGLDLVLWGLMLFIPVKFISSFAIESDVFAAALIVAASYFFAVYLEKGAPRSLVAAALIGGLATLTKYTGAVVACYFGLVLLWQLVRSRERRALVHGLVYAGLVSVLGGWLYVSNLVQYGTPFAGNPDWHRDGQFWDHYDYTSFGLRRIVGTYHLTSPSGGRGPLRNFPQYNQQVATSLYGQLWTDFSFFSVPGRHELGEFKPVYTGKWVPLTLIWWILIAGTIPVLLAAAGFVMLLIERQAGFLIGLFLISIAVYVTWYSSSNVWMLKSKYLLFLLPMFLVFIDKAADWAGPRLCTWLVLPSVVLSAVYCFVFAVG